MSEGKQYDKHLEMTRITAEDWLLPDRMNLVPPRVPQERWADYFLQPKLDAAVPLEVQRLFEVARASMIYSWFYYPLATLGAEQLFRIAELAVWERCRLLQRAGDNFSRNLQTLVAAGVLSAAEEQRWQAMRRLRNDRSHPKSFMLLDPPQAGGQLQTTAEWINALFVGTS